jgi:hypothetical protein
VRFAARHGNRSLFAATVIAALHSGDAAPCD